MATDKETIIKVDPKIDTYEEDVLNALDNIKRAILTVSTALTQKDE